MIKLNKLDRLPLSLLDKHSHIVDLVYLEGPLLSLFRDQKTNWLYLWCDSSTTKERWLIFPVSRNELVSYLRGESSLLSTIIDSSKYYILDATETIKISEENPNDKVVSSHRLLKELNDLNLINEYLPAEDSFFDPSLAPNIELNRELDPTTFDVPIDGKWFVSDLERFNRLYAQLYGFFYCSQPQFIGDLGKKVARNLYAPWQGGFSRVHLFESLKKMVPSIHDLEIKKMSYSSPGEIRIEALASVGQSVSAVLLRFIENEKLILDSLRGINSLLSSSKLNTADLSLFNDDQLNLNETHKLFLKQKQDTIADALDLKQELTELTVHSPNIVVSSKVVVALVSRVQRLAEFEQTGLLDLKRVTNINIT